MTPSHNPVRVWGIVPAAGMGRRMGAFKQSLPHKRSTMAATVVRTLLDADIAGVVVVTRTELVHALDLPDDARIHVAINDDENSEMIESIQIALAELTGRMIQDADRKSADDQPDPPARRPHSLFTIHHSRFDAEGVAVVPADMPSLSPDACRRCIAAFAADTDRIVIATCAGKRGHPIVFPLNMHPTVARLEGGLRALPRTYPDRVHLVETGDAGAVQDVDTPEDFEQL